jgi:hypothetical protein
MSPREQAGTAFGSGRPFTVGVEEELFLVDPVTGRQANASAAVQRRLGSVEGTVERELHACQVELITGICDSAGEAVGTLQGLRRAVLATGAGLLGSGLRRTAAILLPLAAGGLLTACGKSAHLGGAKTGARSPTHVRLGLTGASAQKLARTLNLRASDLPGFTASSEHKRETLVEKKLDRKLARCMGRHATSNALAEANSRSFERRIDVIRLSVSSSVTIVATPAQAAAELKAIRSAHTRVCLTSFLRELLAQQTQGGTSAKLVSIRSGTPSAAGTSGTFAWRITGAFELHGAKGLFYIELVGFAHGRDDVQMLSFGLPVARANAGAAPGSEKGAKPPPKSVVPTGPRRVQISL